MIVAKHRNGPLGTAHLMLQEGSDRLDPFPSIESAKRYVYGIIEQETR